MPFTRQVSMKCYRTDQDLFDEYLLDPRCFQWIGGADCPQSADAARRAQMAMLKNQRVRDNALHLKPHFRQPGTAAAPGRIRDPKWKPRPVPSVKISGSPAWVRDDVHPVILSSCQD